MQQARKETKGIQIRQEEVKLFLFTSNVVVYAENPMSSIKIAAGIDKWVQ